MGESNNCIPLVDSHKDRPINVLYDERKLEKISVSNNVTRWNHAIFHTDSVTAFKNSSQSDIGRRKEQQ
jgi:hypothetical protein